MFRSAKRINEWSRGAHRLRIAWLVALCLGILGLSVWSTTRINASDTIIATVTTGIFVPLSPVNVAVTVGDMSVFLAWSTPASNGGSAITDYVIEYRLSSGGVWSVFLDDVSASTTGTVTGLANDTAYDFRVSAVNGVGQGAPSSFVSATPGSPAQVLLSGFSDTSIPTIVAQARITNEGSGPYEYQYTWCVTTSDSNTCGGGDDVFTAMAAKLIQSGEDWDTVLSATVPSTGSYWFHLEVSFGSDTSHAAQSFVATQESRSSSGGGGGGRRNASRSGTCIGADINRDKIVNLVDFSILLLSFNALPPFKNPCVDITQDGKVSIADFSVMLTQWGKKPVLFIKPTS